MKEFISESDRAAVILGAAKIEALLGQILDRFLLPCTSSTDDLLEGDSPLATFSSRIKMCHRVGLIDDHFAKLLNTFRRLRNGFAHEVTNSSLSSGSARDRVLSLVEPFLDSIQFQKALQLVAKQTSREESDLGVMFRAVLAMFFVHLSGIQQYLTPLKAVCGIGIVAMSKSEADQS